MFGEMAMFRLAPDKSDRRKAESAWGLGMFVGIETRSSEYLFVNETGIYKGRSMKRLPRDKAFRVECLEEVKITINGYIDTGARTSVECRQGELAKEGVAGGRTFAPRRARWLPSDFQKHGFTENCRGCIHLQDGVGPRMGHNEERRRRMEEILRQSEEGKDRVARAEGRQEHWIAGEVEKADGKDKEENPVECSEEIQLEDLDAKNSEVLEQNQDMPSAKSAPI